MAQAETDSRYVLGLDLGSASIGWALVRLNAEGRHDGLLTSAGLGGREIPACGVRIFEPGVQGTALDILQGKDQSRAVDRRNARLQRRQIRRRVWRQAKLFRLLQAHHLLPPINAGRDSTPSEHRHEILNRLDQHLSAKYRLADGPVADQVPLYRLRKRALDHRLEPEELGRVLFHLSQRRGFKSNRKEIPKGKKADEDLGAVKADILSLAEAIRDSGARTLGEYFAGVDPHAHRIRRRWTARGMYEAEFELLWSIQAQFHREALTESLKKEVRQLLFFQRPIAAQSHLIGRCELEGPNFRRAPWAALAAQRFRIWQKINDLRIIQPGVIESEPLSLAQRALIYDRMDTTGDQSFAALRKLLKLPRGTAFNLERGDEKRLRGNRTNSQLREVFGDRWAELTSDAQNEIIESWRTSESDETLVRHGIERWGLDENAARLLVERKPEPGYCALSRRAISKLLPLMVGGKSFKEAETTIYGSRFSGGQALDCLPPLRTHRKIVGCAATEARLRTLKLADLRNPAVERALTELRKVVNAIVRSHGKPYEIRIELARELKKPRRERQAATKTNRDHEKGRDVLKSRLLRECGIQNPSREDVEKARLHAECGGVCPYTGKAIEFGRLFGEQPQFDVEHIIPISRFPDDSFQNKTLCWHEENRHVKRGQTPFEAYGPDATRWDEILCRVGHWNPGNPGKLRRFGLRSAEELGNFSARQMNDTRYASVVAARLLGSLYGGRDVETATGTRQVVFSSTGMVTATLRRAWGLEGILRAVEHGGSEESRKPRGDHRHHAVDAIVIALTRQSVVQSMSVAASSDPRNADTVHAASRIQAPWSDFVASVRPHVLGITVSHRPDHKLTGALHDETIYSPPVERDGKSLVRIRKPVGVLKQSELGAIADKAVAKAVRAKAAAFGGDLKQCETSNDYPVLTSRTGAATPIRRVRIEKVLSVRPVGSGDRKRFVAVANSHHTSVFALCEKGRETRWGGIPVSLFEAMDRKRRKLPVIDRRHPEGPDWVFKFALMGGDTVELHRDCAHLEGRCKPGIFRVRTIASNGQLALVPINDARMKKEIQASGQWWQPRAEALRSLGCQKVVVDAIGRVQPAND